jgi:site-specific recombinase XerD
MSLIAPTLQGFFTDRLARQRGASPRTVASYRDSLRMLVAFVHNRTGKRPCTLAWEDLDAEMICAFLDHLEAERHNSPRTRNLRLTAIRSLFAYASLRHPEHAALIQRVLAIPAKRFDKPIVSFLTAVEVDALIDAPDRARWEGRRDRTLLLVAVQTGLRVSELTGLDCGDVSLSTGAHVRCEGKGRRHRAVPLTAPTESVLKVWLNERAGRRDEPLFPTRTGRRLSTDAVERLVHKHGATAAARCPSFRAEKLHPHTLRHSCAMTLLQAGVDTAVIALWLGHADIRSTHVYLHADMTIKQRALDLTTPASIPPGRYRPTDSLLAFLEGL